MSNSKVRLGIIGVGAIGQWHVQAFGKNASVEILALCDQSQAWLDHCKETWHPRYTFTDWQELLKCDELDAVSVCLPTVFHDTVSIAALKAGKHVLCEKPMTHSVEKAQAMQKAAKSSKKILMTSFNQRLGSDIQFLKKHIEEGHMGRVYLVRTGWRRPMGCLPPPTMDRATGAYNRNWFNEKGKGGGVLWDLGSHVVDLALYLLGFPEPKEILGKTYTQFLPDFLSGTGHPGDADDHSVGFVSFQNGASMQVEVSFGSFVEGEKVFQAVYGDKGGAHRESGSPLKIFTQTSGAYSTVFPRVDGDSPTPMDHFVDCILHDKPPLITPEQGLAVTRILEGIYKSSAG